MVSRLKQKPPSATEGPILGPLLRLALPFAIGNSLSLAMLIVDRLWVGEVGTEALAALGTAHAALMIFMTLSMGMAVGTLSGVARSIGAEDPDAAAHCFGQGIRIALFLGAAFLLSTLWLPEIVMNFMGADAAVAGPATDYLRVSLGGLAIYAPLQTLLFALQGAGEARASMRLSAVAPIVNAVLDPLFIFVFGLGLVGAAWATVLSSVVALLVGGLMIGTGELRIQPGWDSLRWRPDVVRSIVRVGIPGSLEHMVRTSASFALVKMLTGFGAAVMSAYTTNLVLQMMLIFPGLAVGQATASLMGQNLGAGQPERAWRTAWAAVGLYLGFMLIMGSVFWIFAGDLIGLFDRNPLVIEEGQRMMRIVVLCFPLLAITLVLSRGMAGAGTTLPSMMASIFAHLIFQIPVVYFLGQRWGATGAYWGMASAFMLQGLIMAVIFYRKFHPRRAPYEKT